MKKVVRLTESELKGILERSARRIVNEHINYDREIALAQKELYNMGKNLSSIGMRLEGTEYYDLYRKMADCMTQLNNNLIRHLKR